LAITQTELEAAVAAARAAGDILRAGLGAEHDIHWKGPTDLVTEIDRASEGCIAGVLEAATPGYGLLSEEGGGAAGSGAARWIVDPLDGTTNYVHGLPRFCVSIALERDGQVELGVIYDPTRDELFLAQRGAGATLNGRPIRVSGAAALAAALLTTGFPYAAWQSARDNTTETAYFVKHARAVRCTGSAALDLAGVACGRADAHWEIGLLPHDKAAGVLLVREAGGVATDYAGSEDVLYSAETVAGAPAVHAALLAYLQGRR
jgi:myo-inositol-1(or 4)-monophosphatase